MKALYPEINSFNEGYLKVSDIHEIFYEESGTRGKQAVVFLHGGPGGGIQPNYRRYFDPERYHIILF